MDARSEIVEQLKNAQNKKYFDGAPDVKKFPNGMAEFPVSKLRKYCEKHGMIEDEALSYGIFLPYAEPGVYNYELTDHDFKAEVLIRHVYYIDRGDGENSIDQRQEIENPNALMKASILRRFFEGEADVCGLMSLDPVGNLWVNIKPEDNLQVILTLVLDPKGFGLEFSTFDENDFCLDSSRLSFNGESFFCMPVDPVGSDRLS